MAAIKFARPEELPQGFLYRDDFLGVDEESELLRIFRQLNFAPYEYHGYLAKRRVARYGVDYETKSREPQQTAQLIPEFLFSVRSRAAEFAGLPVESLVQAMLAEYSEGTPIGWHRDAPQFGMIVGISLGSACRMRFKPHPSPGKILSVLLRPRSIYVLRGAVRSEWQHSIPSVEQIRYSITFRTLWRQKRKHQT